MYILALNMEPVPAGYINYISESFSINRLSETKKQQLNIALTILEEKKAKNNNKCCIAGGFAAYLVNRTLLYDDIDIYEDNLNHLSNAIKYSSLKSSYFSFKGEKFNEVSTRKFKGNYEYFVFSILESFDMNICRVGIYISEKDDLRIIKFPQNSTDLAYADNLIRMNKYLNRLVDKNNTSYNPKKLSLISYIKLCKCQQHTPLKACIRYRASNYRY